MQCACLAGLRESREELEASADVSACGKGAILRLPRVGGRTGAGEGIKRQSFERSEFLPCEFCSSGRGLSIRNSKSDFIKKKKV